METMQPFEMVSTLELVKLNESLGRLNGDMGLFREFIHIFLEDSPDMMADIFAAAESKDSDRLERSAHALKGLVSNFGAMPFVDLTRQIERAGKESDLNGLNDPLARLSQLHKQLCDELVKFQ